MYVHVYHWQQDVVTWPEIIESLHKKRPEIQPAHAQLTASTARFPFQEAGRLASVPTAQPSWRGVGCKRRPAPYSFPRTLDCRLNWGRCLPVHKVIPEIGISSTKTSLQADGKGGDATSKSTLLIPAAMCFPCWDTGHHTLTFLTLAPSKRECINFRKPRTLARLKVDSITFPGLVFAAQKMFS